MSYNRLFPLIENEQGRAFQLCQSRFRVACAGRRSGKTERAKRDGAKRSILHAKPWPGRYGFLAPTNQQARSIWWKDLKQMIPKALMIGSPRETDMTIQLITGTELVVCGLDKPARIEGSPWDEFFIDEIDDIKHPRQTWAEHLRPCLSDRLGKATFTGVPNQLGFLYDLKLKAMEDPENWSFFSWPSSEVLPAHEIEAARNELDPISFRQEYEASFETFGGRPYYGFDDDSIKSCPADVFRHGVLAAGLDFNVVPYLPATLIVHDGDTAYVIDEIDMPNGNTPAIAAEMREKWPELRNVYPDPTGAARKTSNVASKTDFVILREAGFNVYAHSRTMSVKDRITACNSRFCSAAGKRRLFVDPKCKKTIEALRRHQYKRDTMQPDDDYYVHRCDSLCYVVDYLWPKRDIYTGQGKATF